MSLANTRVCLIYPRQCPPTGEKKRFIQGQRGSCEEHSIIELENDTSVRFISMYGLGNPAAAILISFLLPLVNRSREKYACYSRLIRARIQKEVGDSKKKGGGEEKKRTVQFVSSTLRFENGGVRGSCSTILRSRFLRFIVNDCPASRRCLLIHRRCL